MKRVSLAVALVALVCVMVPAAARADNTTCANADFLPLGQLKSDFVSDTQIEQWYRVKFHADRSYAGLAWTPTGTAGDEVTTISLAVNYFLDDCVTAAAFDLEGFVNREGNPDVTGHDGGYRAVVVGDTDCALSGGCTYRVRVRQTGLGAGEGYTIHVIVMETSLYAPFYQVATSAGYDSAPQIRNSAGGSNNVVRFITFNTAGTKTCTADFNIAANGMTTFGVSSQCGTTSAFGSAAFLHIAPPGGITCNITTFSAASGLSFDAPCFAKMEWSLIDRN